MSKDASNHGFCLVDMERMSNTWPTPSCSESKMASRISIQYSSRATSSMAIKDPSSPADRYRAMRTEANVS
ncbi:predicted protein [Chaetomium globosum CBS 148.51]|uniref:Uncharacterized protein n=1 Tax=Chaetomium globosum (strain ATCC 6205 / CBS 148.51 / DSM 1962 / NBRC 6347 / NRRL 1970) TaxID=306901 RepID=Q2HCR0_CHAGB|nr:uncharacterized protein CHGG_01994 [Chaetomium globosum CBS 148.51]EAQ93759.1 predicted protein [Chaetomium globosum CBS 148.51]